MIEKLQEEVDLALLLGGRVANEITLNCLCNCCNCTWGPPLGEIASLSVFPSAIHFPFFCLSHSMIFGLL